MSGQNFECEHDVLSRLFDTEVIQPSFCRSSGPFLRLRSVLSEVSNSNQLEFLRVCIDPFETTQALFLCSVLGRR